MQKNLIAELLREYLNIFRDTYEAGGGYRYRFDHGVRVMRYCEKFLTLAYFKDMQIDKDALLIAALFSDVGKIKSVNSKGELRYGTVADRRHAEIGARLVVKYIGKYGLDEKKIKKIQDIIDQQHGKKAVSVEAKMVKDADRLDSYGCQQIWRHITYANYDKKGLDHLYEYWLKENAREKSKKYLNKFYFPVIKNIAKTRFRNLDKLIQQIRMESQAEDIK